MIYQVHREGKRGINDLGPNLGILKNGLPPFEINFMKKWFILNALFSKYYKCTVYRAPT